MNRRLLTLAIVILAASVATGGDKPSAGLQTQDYFESGDGPSAAGYCGMCVVSRRNNPVACFGLHKLPNEKTRYGYLLLFKVPAADAEGGLKSVEGSGKSTNGSLDMHATVHWKQQDIDVAWQFAVDEKKNVLASETVKLAGVETKPDATRIYVIDLTQREVSLVPVKIDGAIEVPDITDREQKTWAKSIDAAIEQLKDRSPEVKRLLG